MPDFAEAHMVDGDLVGAQMDDMRSSWNRQRETILSPIPFLGTGAQAIAAAGGVKITVHQSRTSMKALCSHWFVRDHRYRRLIQNVAGLLCSKRGGRSFCI